MPEEEEDFRFKPPEKRLNELEKRLGNLGEKVDFLYRIINAAISRKRIEITEAKPEMLLEEIEKVGEKFSLVQLGETENYRVKDISLAEQGKLKIEWAERHMPVLMKIRGEFELTKPLAGVRLAACLHVTKETAVLMKTLKAGGAEVALCGSNPLSTQDDVAAALAKEGIKIFAWRGLSNDDYYWCINRALDIKPNITLDDGADLISTIHSKRTDLIENIIGSQEETTTGVIRLKAMADDGALKFPVIAVNDTPTKRMFDNVYGTGQSTIDGILRATNVLLAGKNFVVCGYGYCAGGIATRAKGMGAHVIVTEVDPTKALRATLDGFVVMPLIDAAKVGDIFVTATGGKNIISEEHMMEMKDGAILANSGHFNVEISIPDLEKISVSKRKIRENVEEYTTCDGRKLYLLAEGRLVNLAAAEGHPSDVMDMSFSDQALCTKFIVENVRSLENRVHNVPEEIDRRVAKLKLESMGIRIDELTGEQKEYLQSWKEGT